MNASSDQPPDGWLPSFLEGQLDDTAASALTEKPLPAGVLPHLALHRLLPLALQDEAGEDFVREVTERIEASGQDGTPAAEAFVGRVLEQLRPSVPVYRRWPLWAAAAAIAVAGLFFFVRPGGVESKGNEGLVVNTTVPLPPGAVASLGRMESTVWQMAPTGPLLPGTRLTLQQGLVEVHFLSGTQLILEGPADLQIGGSNAAVLHSGRAVAQVPEAGRGFVLDSPRGRLIDHGTQFAVSVELSGETEVHVIEGLVEARQTGGPEPVMLHSAQGLRLSPQGHERLAADDGGFVTEMPPLGQAGAAFVHWPLDEAADGLIANRGQGFDSRETQLNLLSFEPGRPGPQPVSGPFAKALFFDGTGDFAACEWLGIPGAAARTVAFWVQVPADFNEREGFGIVGWGEHSTQGGAWQISPNPLVKDGPLGRLRVGTQEGHVIGTRDLRDGQWHHVAVVLYGGTRPNTATHVLLYVDGLLDPASKKKVREIATDTDRALHGVWLGRNLAFKGTESGVPPAEKFFRGALDEVFIVGAALNQAQIQRLMRENRLE
jgi:hypothetical protein